MIITPTQVTTHPGARIVFQSDRPISTLVGAQVIVYFPGRPEENATIHETNNTFSWIVPPIPGMHEASVLLRSVDGDEWAEFIITINPAQAPVINVTSAPLIAPTPPVYADIYDPVGELKDSILLGNGPNFTVTRRPDADWLAGIYNIYIRDTNGVQDHVVAHVSRPEFASMKDFYSLPTWQRQLIEYIKYEMMGDTDPLHPGAFFTLEEYAHHWIDVVNEINNLPPHTQLPARGMPLFMSNTLVKGTLCRVYHALANRSVTIPRYQGINVPMRDESHYQQAWETRYKMLRPEYEEERAYAKQHFLPSPAITVDPWMGWMGGSMAGLAGIAQLNRPTWFRRSWG